MLRRSLWASRGAASRNYLCVQLWFYYSLIRGKKFKFSWASIYYKMKWCYFLSITDIRNTEQLMSYRVEYIVLMYFKYKRNAILSVQQDTPLGLSCSWGKKFPLFCPVPTDQRPSVPQIMCEQQSWWTQSTGLKTTPCASSTNRLTVILARQCRLSVRSKNLIARVLRGSLKWECRNCS